MNGTLIHSKLARMAQRALAHPQHAVANANMMLIHVLRMSVAAARGAYQHVDQHAIAQGTILHARCAGAGMQGRGEAGAHMRAHADVALIDAQSTGPRRALVGKGVGGIAAGLLPRLPLVGRRPVHAVELHLALRLQPYTFSA